MQIQEDRLLDARGLLCPMPVVKAGKVIARTAPRIGELFLDGRPGRIDSGLDYIPAQTS